MNSFDVDGVITIGIYPGPDDIIITGRCIDEQERVLDMLKEKGIYNPVYFNPMTLAQRGNHTIEARKHSGFHKARVLMQLDAADFGAIQYHFEDDPIQQQIIEEWGPASVTVIGINSPTEK